MRRILALFAITLLAGLGLVACGKSDTPAPKNAAATSAAASTAGSKGNTAPKPGAPSKAAVPQRVADTLAKIDAGDWPPKGDSGTQGGRNFGNFEGRLPKTGADGKPAKYTEWDVNVKKSGRGRDAERIITGADGSAWYTLDHYETFTRIR